MTEHRIEIVPERRTAENGASFVLYAMACTCGRAGIKWGDPDKAAADVMKHATATAVPAVPAIRPQHRTALRVVGYENGYGFFADCSCGRFRTGASNKPDYALALAEKHVAEHTPVSESAADVNAETGTHTPV